jgi:outer membrane lipoprotein-sorting protein
MKLQFSHLFILTISLFFSACTQSEALVEPKSESFMQGQNDGCTTATGEYTKNSELFNNQSDYAQGWFTGRKNCNPINSQQ